MTRSSPIYNFAARFSIPKNQDQAYGEGLVPEFTEFLEEQFDADKYIFQLEDSWKEKTSEEIEEIQSMWHPPQVFPTHNLHLQVFFHTKQKTRVSTLVKILAESQFSGMYLAPASNAGKASLKKYAMKKESRVAGPFADKPIYLGADLVTRSSFTEGQLNLETFLLRCDPIRYSKRKVIWVYDPVGGSGKSAFKKYCQYHHGWVGFSYASAKDILYIVNKFQNKRVYFFNLSKTRSAEISESELYAALESIKDGDFLSTKYEPETVMMNPCHVVVFANHLPRMSALTRGRFEIIKWSPLPERIVAGQVFEHDFNTSTSQLMSPEDVERELEQTVCQL